MSPRLSLSLAYLKYIGFNKKDKKFQSAGSIILTLTGLFFKTLSQETKEKSSVLATLG
jgi:hypothetical protein